MMEDAGEVEGTTLESESFRASKQPKEDLYGEADAVMKQFKTGSTILGIVVTGLFAVYTIGLFRRIKREDYEPHRGNCVSCGRCFSYCPKEQLLRSRRKADGKVVKIP